MIFELLVVAIAGIIIGMNIRQEILLQKYNNQVNSTS